VNKTSVRVFSLRTLQRSIVYLLSLRFVLSISCTLYEPSSTFDRLSIPILKQDSSASCFDPLFHITTLSLRLCERCASPDSRLADFRNSPCNFFDSSAALPPNLYILLEGLEIPVGQSSAAQASLNIAGRDMSLEDSFFEVSVFSNSLSQTRWSRPSTRYQVSQFET